MSWKVGFSGDGPDICEGIQESDFFAACFGESEGNALRGFYNALRAAIFAGSPRRVEQLLHSLLPLPLPPLLSLCRREK